MSRADEIAWAAGFFEGEGTIYAHYYKPRQDGSQVFRVSLSLVQKDYDLLEYFKAVVGSGIVYGPNDKGIFSWKSSSWRDAEEVFHSLEPWLSPRRCDRYYELKYIEQSQVFNPPKPKRTHCSIGHNLQDVGTRKDGTCAECDRKYEREWYRQNRRKYESA